MIAILRRLRSPDLGIFGQVLRFAVAGGTVAVVYVLATLLLSHVAGLHFQAALAVGFALALATHFMLQRLFVWVNRDGFALSIDRQAGRYLAVSLTQYGLTALATATLPGLLDTPTDVVYLATTACLSVSNFLIFRSHVFHAQPPAAGGAP